MSGSRAVGRCVVPVRDEWVELGEDAHDGVLEPDGGSVASRRSTESGAPDRSALTPLTSSEAIAWK